MKLVNIFGVTSFFLLFSGFAQAQDPSKLTFNGFVSTSLVNSEGINNYSDGKMSPNFHEAAANFLYQPEEASSLSFSGQVLYRQLGDQDPQTPINVDYLFASYDLVKTNQVNFGVRLGRVKNFSGIYNRTRDVPHSYPGAWVPSVVYNEHLREIQSSLDGISFYGSSNSELGFVEYQLSAGRSGAKRSVYIEEIYFTQDIQGHFEDRSPTMNAALFFTPAAAPSLTLGYSYIGLDLELVDAQDSQTAATALYVDSLAYGGLPDALRNPDFAPSKYANFADVTVDIHVLSAQYSWQRFVLTGEYIRILAPFELGIEGQPSTYYQKDSEIEGAYIQLEWLASSSLNFMIRHEELYIDRLFGDKPDDPTMHRKYAIAETLAARYFVTQDLSLTLEQSWVEGTGFVTKGEQTNQYWRQTSLRLTYDF